MIKKRIRGRIPLLPSAIFFLAANAIISGNYLFLLLRVDKLRRLLLDRDVSKVHSFQKSTHDPKLTVGHFALADKCFSCFCVSTFSFVLIKKNPHLEAISKRLYRRQFSAQCMMDFCSVVETMARFRSEFRLNVLVLFFVVVVCFLFYIRKLGSD